MNIKEAKEVIIHTVQAYLDKDETAESAWSLIPSLTTPGRAPSAFLLFPEKTMAAGSTP